MTETTRERFNRQVREQGGEPAYDKWLGTNKPHKIICTHGHEGSPRPDDVQRGQGICRKCGHKCMNVARSEQAEENFRARVEALGGTCAYKEWLGVQKLHKVICAKGHECSPSPDNVQRGQGICRKCAGNDPEQAEEAFRARVEALGGTCDYGEWLGNKKPHKVICAKGHECSPRPTNVQKGRGICRKCAGHDYDVFYIVSNPITHEVKFGVTSGDPRPRLSNHKADGFIQQHRLWTEFPEAYVLECAVKIGLLGAGFKPTRGWEYFRLEALPFILSMCPG